MQDKVNQFLRCPDCRSSQARIRLCPLKHDHLVSNCSPCTNAFHFFGKAVVTTTKPHNFIPKQAEPDICKECGSSIYFHQRNVLPEPTVSAPPNGMWHSAEIKRNDLIWAGVALIIINLIIGLLLKHLFIAH